MGPVLDGALWNFRATAKALIRDASTAGLAVVQFTLGIGAAMCVFAVVNGVLLQSLPYGAGDDLVWVWSAHPDGRQRVSFPDFTDWREQSSTLELVGWGGYESVLTVDGNPERIQSAFFLGDLFGLLDVSPQLGQNRIDYLTDAEEPLIVLSHGLWEDHFGRDAGVVGRQIFLDDVGYTVGAVMPAGFKFPMESSPGVDLWIPLEQFNPFLASARDARVIEVIGRLRDGAALSDAQAEMDVIAAALESDYPDTNADYGVLVVPALEELSGGVKETLWIVFGAVLILLLITCVNPSVAQTLTLYEATSSRSR